MKEFVEKLIEKIEKEAFAVQLNQGIKHPSTHDMFLETFTVRQIEEIVNQLAEEYNNGWIPVSERLPECENGCETKALMFQMKETGSIKCGYYGEGGFYRDKYFRTYTNNTDGYDARDVIAWQPLPAPYQKGE